MKEQPGSRDYRDPNRFDYHYSRDDRLSKLPPDLRPKIGGELPRGFFKRNRTLSIILVDIALIALVWFVFLPLIRTGAAGKLEGYSFSLHGFSYGGNALITLKVMNDGGRSGLPPGYTAVFGLSSSDHSVEMQGSLPEAKGHSTALRTSIPLPGKTTSVICTVKLGAKHLNLKAKLQSE